MKKHLSFLIVLALCLTMSACSHAPCAQVAATTLPVYQFTTAITQGTPITVTRLVTQSVSCLHDYTLTVDQMRAIEGAQVVVISGAGLEEFMAEPLSKADRVVDASPGISLLEPHEHDHEEEAAPSHHHHESDPHIWLSPKNAAVMASNICAGLTEEYPQHSQIFEENLRQLTQQLEVLDAYGAQQLDALSCRELITFHDGFGYLADAYDLHILEAIEEDSGSEASAGELTHLIRLAADHHLPAIFTEVNGAVSAGSIISASADIPVYALDMAMAGDDYFAAMYHNIDTLKEALQ